MYYMINGHFRLVQKSETGTTGCHFGKIFVIKSHFPNTVYSECAQAEEGPQSKYSGFSFLPYNLKKKVHMKNTSLCWDTEPVGRSLESVSSSRGPISVTASVLIVCILSGELILNLGFAWLVYLLLPSTFASATSLSWHQCVPLDQLDIWLVRRLKPLLIELGNFEWLEINLNLSKRLFLMPVGLSDLKRIKET